MKRIIVTGGAGFIGSHIVDWFVNRGDRVVIIDDLSTGRLRYVNPKAIFFRLDVASPKSRKVIEKFHPTSIVHIAAQKSMVFSQKDPMFDARVNIMGSLNMLQSAIACRARSFVFASTAALYSDYAPVPTRESEYPAPPSPYGVSKITVEFYMDFYNRFHGLRTVAFRFANVYGPRQDASGESGVVAKFSYDALRGDDLTIHGDGKQTRDLVYVTDIARAVAIAVDRNVQGVYNLALSKETTVNTLAKLIIQVAKSESRIRHDAAIRGERRFSALDPSRAKKRLGWSAKVSLLEGLKITVPWFEKYDKKSYR